MATRRAFMRSGLDASIEWRKGGSNWFTAALGNSRVAFLLHVFYATEFQGECWQYSVHIDTGDPSGQGERMIAGRKKTLELAKEAVATWLRQETGSAVIIAEQLELKLT